MRKRMTTLFWAQFSALIIICHLLASTTVLSQKKSNRYRKTTATVNASPSDMPLSTLQELQTTRSLLQESPIAELFWNAGVLHSSSGRVTRKTPHNRKARNETTSEHVFKTAAPVLKSRDGDGHTSTTVQNRMMLQSENAPRYTEIPPFIAGQHQGPVVTKSYSSTMDKETASVVGHHRNPRVRTSTTYVPTTPATAQARDFPNSNAEPYSTNPSEVKFNESESKPSLGKDSSACRNACDMSFCPQVEAESCKGRVIKDNCNCCPVCLLESTLANYSKDDFSSKKPSYYPKNACDGMICTKNKVCILNIQGIPMCRCPNIYSCRNGERNLLCSQTGVTFKNKCFLKVEECTTGKRIRVIHKGACRTRPATTHVPSTLARVSSNLPTNSYTNDRTKRKPGKSSKNAGNKWRDAAVKDEKRAYENRHRKRFGNGNRPLA